MLKIIIEEPLDGEEEHIIVKCHELSAELQSALKIIKAIDDKLIGTIGNKVFRIDPLDIFYIETVENRTFLYGEHDVYESKLKLYELEEQLASKKFLRASKSFIVNLRAVRSLAPATQGKLEVGLVNGENIIASKHYASKFKIVLKTEKSNSL